MLRKDFIICKTRDQTSEFINPVIAAADKHGRKLSRQVVGAILLSGSFVVTESSHLIRDDCSDIFIVRNDC